MQPANEAAKAQPEVALVVHGVSKSYPGVTALDDVSMTVDAGSVHALVGENGAGKSTLVKIITGATVPDHGELRIGDVTVAGLTPRRAGALGVTAIHQERQIAYDLTVGENVMLGRIPLHRWGGVDWDALRREAADRLAQVGLEVDARAPVRELGVAELQALEIARALSADARLLVMDEPTSALTGGDIRKLFATIRNLRSLGVAIVYISHHLSEIMEVADQVTVLRDGRRVATGPVAETDEDRLITQMLGRPAENQVQRSDNGTAADPSRRVVLRADSITRGTALSGISIDVHQGEVLCIAGSAGSGRRELARCLAGVDRPETGRVEAQGKVLRGPRDAIRHGVVFLPADRKHEGLLLALSVLDNIAAAGIAQQTRPIVNYRRWRKEASRLVEGLGIKTRSLDTPVRLLSGGNQQKAIVARWLAADAQVFVFDEPTAGIDVGSKVEIYRLLRGLVEKGASAVLFSSDYAEIQAMADRAIVLYRGRVAGELGRGEISEESLLALELEAS